MKKLWKRAACLLCAAALCMGLLSACAGLGDYAIRLAEGYTFYRSSAYMRTIGGPCGVGTYVSQVYFDENYIFAQRLDVDPEYPQKYNQPEYRNQSPVDFDAPPDYYVIILATDELLGPMTAGEFYAWYAALDPPGDPQWIDTRSEPALRARSDELGLVTPEPAPPSRDLSRFDLPFDLP